MKSSAVCFNISPAIVASGRERRRNFSEETDDDYPDSGVGRPSRALLRGRPLHSTFAVAALGLAVLAAVAIALAFAIPNLLTSARSTSP